MDKNNLRAMSTLEIRPATAADLPAITEIYDHAVRYGTATFELTPPDLAEMSRRFGVHCGTAVIPISPPHRTAA